MNEPSLQAYRQALQAYAERTGVDLDADTPSIEALRQSNKAPLPVRLRRRLARYRNRLELMALGEWNRSYWIARRDTPTLTLDDDGPIAQRDHAIGVHLHVFFMDVLPELLQALENVPGGFSVYATTNSEAKAGAIRHLLPMVPGLHRHEVIVTPNRGRDLGPWLVEMARFNGDHELWCHLHTKKSLHVPRIGERWRHFLTAHALGSEERVSRIIGWFESDPRLGVVIPPFFTEAVRPELQGWDDLDRAAALFRALGIGRKPPTNAVFPAGSFFWYRSDALAPLFEHGFTFEDFEPESGQTSLTIMHQIERSIVYVAENQGYAHRVTRVA